MTRLSEFRKRTLDTDTDARLQLMSLLGVPLFLVDIEELAIVWANELAIEFWGAASAVELYQQDFRQGMTTTYSLRLSQLRQDCFEQSRSFSEHWTIHPNGVRKSANFQFSPFASLDGRELLLINVENEDLKLSDEAAYRTTALMHTSTMISAYDKKMQLVYCNTAARKSLPLGMNNARNRINDPEELTRIVNKMLIQDQLSNELKVNTQGGTRWHSFHIERCINPTSGKTLYMVSETDITEARESKREVHKLAFTDSLTGLPNRTALNNHLAVVAKSDDASFAVMFLDLDRFKAVNDSLGHAVGDQLLIDIALRLRQATGKRGLVSRLGGDEFVIVIDKEVDRVSLESMAEQILFSMASPVVISGNKLRVLPSIGISIFPIDSISISGIMGAADDAMYVAKNKRCGYHFYDREMLSSISDEARDRMGLEVDMPAAIEHDEFELYFQPKITCSNQTVHSVEALIRWHHPERGMVEPDKFVGIAEETGQIVELGNWVLLAAMRQQKRWQEQGLSIPVSVNISARQFLANDLLTSVSDALAETGCNPKMIELEITESMLVGEPDAVHTTLGHLDSMGIKLALDDFGTGYSNLAQLQLYPLSCLKIDKTFLINPERSLLLRTVLNMGKVLGLEVVAEGVETSSQVEWLSRHGCDLMQGFYFCRPQAEAEITQYLFDNGAPRHHLSSKAA